MAGHRGTGNVNKKNEAGARPAIPTHPPSRCAQGTVERSRDIGGLGGAARRSQQSLLKQEVSDGLGVSRARTRFHVCPTLVSTKREGVRPRAKGINKNTQKPGIDNRPNEGGNKRRKQVPEMTPRGNNGHVTTQTDTHREVTWRSLMKLIRCEGTLIDPGRPQGLSDWISNRKGRAKTGFLSGFPELEVQAQEQHRGGSSPLCLPSQPAPALKSLTHHHPHLPPSRVRLRTGQLWTLDGEETVRKEAW